jgi:hypothetical protein
MPGIAIAVGPLRVLHGTGTILNSTIDKTVPATEQLLTAHKTVSPHDPPHLHAFSLRI